LYVMSLAAEDVQSAGHRDRRRVRSHEPDCGWQLGRLRAGRSCREHRTLFPGLVLVRSASGLSHASLVSWPQASSHRLRVAIEPSGCISQLSPLAVAHPVMPPPAPSQASYASPPAARRAASRAARLACGDHAAWAPYGERHRNHPRAPSAGFPRRSGLPTNRQSGCKRSIGVAGSASPASTLWREGGAHASVSTIGAPG
jgi:hypothetical protein